MPPGATSTVAVVDPSCDGDRRRRRKAPVRGLLLLSAALAVALAVGIRVQAFFFLDEKDGRFCGKEGDLCKCFGHVRYGRLFSWSDDIIVDGSVNCSAATFGDPVPLQSVKICKCYPTICTTDVGTCTPEPCECPAARGDAEFEWGKKAMMTSDGTKCWACEKRKSTAGIAIDTESDFCPAQAGRCTFNKACKCEDASATKRVMRTKDGKKCWTCAAVSRGRMDSGQKAMFWLLPLLWPWMDFPNSAWQCIQGCRALTTFLGLCVLGYFCQRWLQFLRLDRFFSFFAPCLKKGEFWRLFTYFMLHSDLQHLCVNLFHLLDTLDLEGVPDLEVSPGVPLRCTRDGPITSICYPDIGIGRFHTVAVIALVLAYGALVGTIKSFGALVQGASSVCFGVDGALIALYGMFLGAGLDQQLKIPEFGMFFWMRIGIIAFHIIIDLVQSLCSGGKDTVGTIAHMSSLVAGFCYVILVLPPMGDGSLFHSETPYIVDCGFTSPRYVTTDDATTECLAFFWKGNGIEVGFAKKIAMVILGGGVLASMVNAFFKRHISDDGIACCTCGDKPGGAGAGQAGGRPSMVEILQQHSGELRKELTQLELLYNKMPDPATLQPLPPATATGSGS